jgi:hypothetical protein
MSDNILAIIITSQGEKRRRPLPLPVDRNTDF